MRENGANFIMAAPHFVYLCRPTDRQQQQQQKQFSANKYDVWKLHSKYKQTKA